MAPGGLTVYWDTLYKITMPLKRWQIPSKGYYLPLLQLLPSWGLVDLFIYLLLYIAFNSQGHIATGSLQVEETSAYYTVNHRASASNYQLSNMKRPVRDSKRRPQRLEARTITTTPPSPLGLGGGWASTSNIRLFFLVICNLKSCLKVTLIFGKE